ncbi:MAG: ABC transporter ATP-binding protein [Muribaculaceae bacterium]
MNVIELSGVSKRYGAVKALSDIDLTVAPGELFGLIGPDGAGKSTLMRIITTLLNADSGSATVCGLDVRRDYRQIRRQVGYMPGKFSLYADLTVQENLEFFAALFGVTVEENYRLIEPIFSQIAPFANRRAGKLSGGMKQKLALCCALVHRPTLLVLDEPTTGVDAVSRSEFWQMLATLRAEGITILASTPYMDEALQCSRVALINGGRIMAVDTPSALESRCPTGIYAACADQMWQLLKALRQLPQVRSVYTFGQAHHVVAAPDFDPAAVAAQLVAEGLQNVEITPVKGNIEDLFIHLIRHGQDN